MVALALYKCHSMGLLPTATSDWLAFMEHKMASSKTVFFFKFSDLLEHLMCILGKGLFLPKKKFARLNELFLWKKRDALSTLLWLDYGFTVFACLYFENLI